MDSKSLRCFLQIVELGSFGRAAQVLKLSQPGLSRRIALLERELGAQLFTRHQRGLSLTPAGTALSNRAETVLNQLEKLREDLVLLDREPSGSLAIGLPPALTHVLNGPLVEMYCAKFPRIKLYVFEGLSHLLEAELLKNNLDMALLLSARSDLRNVSLKVLAIEDLVLASTASDLHSKQSLTVNDISESSLILAKLPNHVRWRLEVEFQQRGLSPKIAAEVNTLPMSLELAARGVGSLIAPRSAVAGDKLASRRLKVTPIRGMTVNWTLAISREHQRSLAAQALAKCIEDVIYTQIKSGNWKARFCATNQNERIQDRRLSGRADP